MNKTDIQQTFAWERELVYLIPKNKFLEVLSPTNPWLTSPISIKRKMTIEQYWMNSGAIDGTNVKMRSRLRKTIYTNKKELYEHTTKYELTSKSRIECNAVLNRIEYEVLEKIVASHAPKTTKTRIEFYTGLEQYDQGIGLWREDSVPLYSADIYPDKNFVRIEIEFPSEQLMKTFVPPAWIQENEIKESE